MLWMFYLRIRTYENFLIGGEVYFSGNDAWYHLRQVQYTVANFPQRMPFDPWTQYPIGRLAGQFGTLYDQLVAAAALAIGLGSPTDQQVAIALLVAPAVFGTLVAIPTYLIGRDLGDRTTGAVAVIILALLPGTFLRRGLVGFADHNIVEPLFMLLALWGLCRPCGIDTGRRSCRHSDTAPSPALRPCCTYGHGRLASCCWGFWPSRCSSRPALTSSMAWITGRAPSRSSLACWWWSSSHSCASTNQGWGSPDRRSCSHWLPSRSSSALWGYWR
jgi:hypothetical protein